jgi:hypothetical protein
MDRRFKSDAERLGRFNVTASGCWEWLGAMLWNGYGRLAPLKGEYLAHRASYASKFGPIPEGAKVLHRCDNRRCINPGHLFLGSSSDNLKDCYQKGRRADTNGERNPFSKLTNSQVSAILRDDRTQKAIAADYGVARSTIGEIKRGRAWRTANATARAQMNLR